MQLSFIITVYNREKYLHRCLTSLLNQDIDKNEFEIVIVNDGSTDCSEKIIDSFVEKYPNIHKFNKQNSGVADTRNVGLMNAHGTYITYIDSDDFVEENSYGAILKFAFEHDYDIVLYDAYKTYDDHKDYYEFDNELAEGEISARDFVLFAPAPWNKIMKKELFTKGNILFPSGINYEDYGTLPLLANTAKSFYYIKKPIVNYYQENASITRSKVSRKAWKDMMVATKNLEKLDPKFHPELEFITYLYLLVRTNTSSYQLERFDEIKEVSHYMKKTYPNWRKNPYVQKRPKQERLLAFLFSINAIRSIKCLLSIKHLKKGN